MDDRVELLVSTAMECSMAQDTQISLFQTSPDEIRIEKQDCKVR